MDVFSYKSDFRLKNEAIQLTKEYTKKKKIHTNDLCKTMNEVRIRGTFCDITLKSTDGGEIRAHRLVLKSATQFFNTLFDSDFSDSTADCIPMNDVSSEILENIVNFLYIGTIKITGKNVKETLDNAIFLGIQPLIEICTEFLIDIVDNENCCQLLSYSETYFWGESLTNKCINHIYHNMQSVIINEDFYNLSSDAIQLLLTETHSANIEESLCSFVIKWIEINTNERLHFLSDFMDKIRFEYISYDFFTSNLMKGNELVNNLAYRSKMFEILCDHISVQNDLGNNTRKLQQSNKISSITGCNKIENVTNENLFVVIGNEILLYDKKEKTFFQTISKEPFGRSCYGYTTFDKKFYTFGGLCNFENEMIESAICNCYCFEKMEWIDLPDLPISSHNLRVTSLDEKIYVFNSELDNSMRIFDIGGGMWSEGVSVNQRMRSVCSYNRCIYAANQNCIQCFDPRENTWINLDSSSSYLQNICEILGYNNSIYKFDKEGICIFDIRNRAWSSDRTIYKKKFISEPKVCITNENEFFLYGVDHSLAYYLSSKNIIQIYNASNLLNCNHFYTELPQQGRMEALFSIEI